MTRLLVMGVTGLLGHQLWRLAWQDSRFKVHGTARDENAVRRSNPSPIEEARIHYCDVRDETRVRRVIEHGFDVVINGVGITKRITDDPITAIEINSLFPHRLARICTDMGSRLIHISTDCVFSGLRGDYSEDDIPDPVDLYGRSKLLGEVTYNNHLTVRTSCIGPELQTQHGLLEWFLAQKGTISGYAKVYWSGFTSMALSRILLELALRPTVAGLLHVGGEKIDKYSLLCKLRGACHKSNIVITRAEQPVCDRSLNNTRFRQVGISYPTIEEMIHELAAIHQSSSAISNRQSPRP